MKTASRLYRCRVTGGYGKYRPEEREKAGPSEGYEGIKINRKNPVVDEGFGLTPEGYESYAVLSDDHLDPARFGICPEARQCPGPHVGTPFGV